MSVAIESSPADLASFDVTELRQLIRLGERYEAVWRGRGGEALPVEPFLADVPEPLLAACERHLRTLATELAGDEEAFPPSPPRYEVRCRLGSGGMGIVYRAYDRATHKEVALKRIKPEILDGLSSEHRADLLARFEREGRLAAGVEHDHVVTIYDVGVCDGVPYYTMRWIDGGTLADRLAAGPLRPRAAVELLLPIVRAAVEVHRKGIIHRDITPRNIFLDSSGRPYLGDFGLAKAIGLPEADNLTVTGMQIGTLPYMAPEQVYDARSVDTACDVYALGATLYRAITGRPPFQAPELLQILNQVHDVEPVAPRRLNPGLPRDLERVTLKCLAKVPRDRYADAEALAADLQRFLDDRPVLARPLDPFTRAWRWMRRSPASAALVGLGSALVLGAVVGAFWWNERRLADAVDRHVTVLRGARPAEAPALLSGLDGFGPRALTVLGSALARVEPGSPEWFNLALGQARLGAPPPGFDRRVLAAPVEQVAAFIRGLPPDSMSDETFRAVLASESGSGPERLRAAAVLAQRVRDRSLWSETLGRELTVPLLDEPPAALTTWSELLEPIAGVLSEPLRTHLRDRTLPESRRLAAAQVLAAWLARSGWDDELRAALKDADGAQVRVLAESLRRKPALMDDLNRRVNEGNDPIEDKARWAVALLLVGRLEAVWPLLRQSPDNGLRTLLVIHLAEWQAPLEVLLDRLRDEPDPSVRRALILALGHYRFDLMTLAERRRATGQVSVAYAADPDPGIHSSAWWTLVRRWMQPLPPLRRPSKARWVVEGGYTLAFVSEGVERPFAVSTTEITAGDFYRLCPSLRTRRHHKATTSDDRPIVHVNFDDAKLFCEKMSEAVGNGRTFRLPTETEWEKAAAAGARTTRFYGEDEKELGRYAWYVSNSGNRIHSVAELLPNDLGLFDVLGNVFEWHVPRPMTLPGGMASTRGGSYGLYAEGVRIRPSPIIPKDPTTSEAYTGFRVVRDLDPDEAASSVAHP